MEKMYVTINGKRYRLVEDPEVLKVYITYKTGKSFVYTLTDSCKLSDGSYNVNGNTLTVTHIKESQVKSIEDKALPYQGFFSGIVDYISNGVYQNPKHNKRTKLQFGDKSKRAFYSPAILEVRPDYAQAVDLLRCGHSMKEVAQMLDISYTSVYKVNVSFCGYTPKEKKCKAKSFVSYKGIVHTCEGEKVNDNIDYPTSNRKYYDKKVFIKHPEYKIAVKLMNNGNTTTKAAEILGITRQTAYKLYCTFCGHNAKTQPKKNYPKTIKKRLK